MFAQLGNVIFKNLKGFSSYSKTGSATYAEHAVLVDKATLQKTGNSLEELSISIRLHASFCNPASELKTLRQYRDQGQVCPLLWGNGTVEGNFVIVELSEEIEDADRDGTVFSYIVSLSLKEYIIKNRLQAEQNSDRKAATAVGDKKPVAKPKTNPGTCAKTISGIVTKIDNHAKDISVIVEIQGGTGNTINRNSVLHHLSAIRLLSEDLLKRCDDPSSCANTLPDLKYRCIQVFNETNNFNQEVANNNVNQVPTENKILAVCVRNLKSAAQELIQKSITGNAD